MQPEEVIAALRFEPLLPLWLIAGARRARAADGGARRLPAGARHGAGGWPASPCCCCGWPARAWCRKAATTSPISACWWSISPPRCRSATVRAWPRRRVPRSPSRRRSCRISSSAPSPCRRAAMPARGCSAPSIGRWPTSRARGWPARSPSPTGRCTTSPTLPPGGAPLNVLIPAKGEETDRRLRVIEAPSYGIVGKTVTLRVAIEDLGVAHPVASANLTIRRDGEPPRVENVPIGAEQRIELPITRAGPTVVELSANAARRARSPRSTTARWSRSTACATGCACC